MILATLPVFELTKIPAIERLNECSELETIQIDAINNNLVIDDENVRNIHLDKILHILKHYVLNETEIYKFIEYLIATGHVPEWSSKHKLKYYHLYKILRCETYVGIIFSSLSDTLNYMTGGPMMKVFQNVIDVSPTTIAYSYFTENFNELLTLSDYYAIMVLLNDLKKINFKNPIGWRIKKALYSLAIRQYSPDVSSTFSPITCFNEDLVIAESINDFKAGRTFKFTDFLFCHKHNNRLQETHSNSPIIKKSNSTHNWIAYRIVITDPRMIVNLDEFTKNKEEDFNIILPHVVFMTMEDPILHDTSYGLVAYVTIETMPITVVSEWLTSIANKINTYKEKEKPYVHKNPRF